MFALVQKQPKWLQKSRIAQRLHKALSYLQEKGSADGFNEYLQYLATQDEEHTHANYGLIRFICWVAPVLGILGTVIHFGSAFGGLSVDEIGDNLAKVIGEIGTAFNTTTVALAAAITMMLSLFLCERAERGIVKSVTRRTDLVLLNRFEVVDESLTPFLQAVQSGSHATLHAMDKTIERQLQLWSTAFHRLQQQSEERIQANAQLWEQSLARWQQRFDESDTLREKKLLGLLGELQAQREEHKNQVQTMANQVSGLYSHLAKFVEALAGLLQGEGQLVKLQSTLDNNLRLLNETHQFDQALHQLTAAIHLLTARHDPDSKGQNRPGGLTGRPMTPAEPLFQQRAQNCYLLASEPLLWLIGPWLHFPPPRGSPRADSCGNPVRLLGLGRLTCLLNFNLRLLEWMLRLRICASQGRRTMKATLYGAAGAALGLVVIWMLVGREAFVFAQRPQVYEATAELIAFPAQIDNTRQQLTVIDPRTHVLSVYHLDLPTGSVTLKSVRNLSWDMQMDEYNGIKPLPREIRAQLQTR